MKAKNTKARPALGFGYGVRYVLSVAAYYLGFIALYRRWRNQKHGPSLRVLAYHGFRDGLPYIEMFMPPHLFDAQIRYLAKRYDVLSVEEYLAVRRGECRLVRESVVLTMDDGYADNYSEAFRTCREIGVPMTVFVTTDCVSKRQPTFVGALIAAMGATRTRTLSLPDFDIVDLPIDTREQKDAAIRAVDELAKRLSPTRRLNLLDAALRAMQVDAGQLGLTGMMLDWRQVKEMRANGVEIGSHTCTHPVLADLTDHDIEREIRGSLEQIELELGQACRLFAYPYGGLRDYDERSEEACLRNGIVAAFTLSRSNPLRDSMTRIGRDMMTVDRCSGPTGAFSPALFEAEVSGFMDRIRRFCGARST